ncbi:Chitinase A1 precursor [Actinomadura rubteroloni]|uniref:Chitinase A1 n=1 Tax=Actinomadura rubteroloni TaxID=1926885 RepID=A0A2P4ULC0_9ACTN|nr:fibronectin type III domain-containing protein [Actinomadura rubteroloni]POM25841.1 Chitinase A1 precursor [Actinomadura rubteroloni]
MDAKITFKRLKTASAVATTAVVAGTLSAVVSLGGSPTAQAAPDGVTLPFKCTFPFIGVQDLSMNIKLPDLPREMVPGGPGPNALHIDAVATIGAKTTQGLRLLDAATLEGSALARARLEQPEPPSVTAKTEAAIAKTPIPPSGSFKVHASGTVNAAPYSDSTKGKGTLTLTSLSLNTKLRKADGGLTDLGDTFTTECTQSGGSNVLAEINFGEPDKKPPTKPGKLTVVQSGKTAYLSWGKASDDRGIVGYKVFNDGKEIPDPTDAEPDRMVGSFGEVTTTTMPVEPGKDYNLTVKAVDAGGNLSDATDPVTFKAGPDAPEKSPPSTPGKPKVTAVGGTWARLEWGASEDNIGVAAYEVYAKEGNGQPKLSGTFPGTDPYGWAEGLKAQHDYTLYVRAKDEAGNASPFSAPVAVHTTNGPPDGCGKYDGAPASQKSRGCVYMAGYNNLNKLNSAVVVNDPKTATHTNIAYQATADGKNIHASFKFAQPLRSPSTVLTFGLMPTTAMMELQQVGNGSLDGIYHSENGGGYEMTAKAKVIVRIYDARANGAPLNVGPACQSSEPVQLTLTATPSEYRDILVGGVLSGKIDLPKFSGCGGKRENMNPVFNAAISGKGNYVKILQGPICKPETTDCRPVTPPR